MIAIPTVIKHYKVIIDKVFTKYKISKVLFQAVKRFWPWLGTKGSRNGRNQIDRRLLHTHTQRTADSRCGTARGAGRAMARENHARKKR